MALDAVMDDVCCHAGPAARRSCRRGGEPHSSALRMSMRQWRCSTHPKQRSALCIICRCVSPGNAMHAHVGRHAASGQQTGFATTCPHHIPGRATPAGRQCQPYRTRLEATQRSTSQSQQGTANVQKGCNDLRIMYHVGAWPHVYVYNDNTTIHVVVATSVPTRPHAGGCAPLTRHASQGTGTGRHRGLRPDSALQRVPEKGTSTTPSVQVFCCTVHRRDASRAGPHKHACTAAGDHTLPIPRPRIYRPCCQYGHPLTKPPTPARSSSSSSPSRDGHHHGQQAAARGGTQAVAGIAATVPGAGSPPGAVAHVGPAVPDLRG